MLSCGTVDYADKVILKFKSVATIQLKATACACVAAVSFSRAREAQKAWGEKKEQKQIGRREERGMKGNACN